MPLPYPLIVVPGITASSLRDEYVIPPETVWSVMTKEYERVSLHPDNVRYEVIEPARVQADQLLEAAYRELIEELRYNLREHQDESVPVFAFPYDWRQPLELSQAQLAVFIDEVIERTKLIRHYAEWSEFSRAPKVNLLGHSMGGLIITGYLSRHGKKARVAKVATLATPFRGSFEAVVKIATGTANLGHGAPSSREREAARATPALYHLIPWCQGIEVDPSVDEPDLFDPAQWQSTILQTLEEYVRLYGVDPTNTAQQAKTLFAALLKTARDFRRRVERFSLARAGLKAEDWLCVVGVDSETRVRLKINRVNPKSPQFEFSPADRDNRWSATNPAEQELTGDGTVPYRGAVPTFLALENLVCVTPSDFGYWEIQDRLFTSVAGFHGILPNMDMLHRMLVRHFTGRLDRRQNTWGLPAPGVAPREWKPPLELSLPPEG